MTKSVKKVALDFMVDPEFLKDHAIVKDGMKVIITDPEAIFLTGILGESGRKLVAAGAPFYFTKRLAIKLVSKNIARFCNTKGIEHGLQIVGVSPGNPAAKLETPL